MSDSIPLMSAGDRRAMLARALARLEQADAEIRSAVALVAELVPPDCDLAVSCQRLLAALEEA